MKFVVELTTTARKDIQKHKKMGNRAVLKKIETLLNELATHPKTGTGQPEILKGDLAGLYSRRINNKHRLIYDVKENIVQVQVIAAWSHCGDK